MKTFKVGNQYETRSACDSECIFNYTILNRTDKTVTIKTIWNKVVKRKIYIYDGAECIKPEGNYSMCPIIRAI